jgi:hypothetical protein
LTNYYWTVAQITVNYRFEVDYYEKLEEVIELQYHSKHNKVFLFKSYWYDTTNRGIRVVLIMIWSKLTQKLDFATSMMSLFSPSNANKLITHTPSLRKDRSRVDWLSILKTKPRGRVEVVQDENDNSNVGDDVFQGSELVEPTHLLEMII